MANWGFMTWDANGKPNNTGISPTSMLGYNQLDEGVLSGTWSFSVPVGRSLKFLFLPNSGNGNVGKGDLRSISAVGNTVTMTAIAGPVTGENIFPPGPAWIIFYVV